MAYVATLHANKKIGASLMTIKQGKNEILLQYLVLFNQATLKIGKIQIISNVFGLKNIGVLHCLV